MGGSVKVESEKGKGTTFIVTLKTKCIMMPKNKAKKMMRKLKGEEIEPEVRVEEVEDVSVAHSYFSNYG